MRGYVSAVRTNSERGISLFIGSRLLKPPPTSSSCGCHPSHARLSSPTRRANRVSEPSSTRCSGGGGPGGSEADELDVRHREDAAAHLDQVPWGMPDL